MEQSEEWKGGKINLNIKIDLKERSNQGRVWRKSLKLVYATCPATLFRKALQPMYETNINSNRNLELTIKVFIYKNLIIAQVLLLPTKVCDHLLLWNEFRYPGF